MLRLFILFYLFVLTGCATESVISTTQSYSALLSEYREESAINKQTGAIYNEANNIFKKSKVSIGDIITINVLENTMAKIGNNINNERNNEVGMSIPLLQLPFLTKLNTTVSGIGYSGKNNNKLQGKEETNSNHTLVATLSVGLIKRYQLKENEIFEIRGEKSITLNQTQTTFIIHGYINAKDIQQSKEGWILSSDKINELTVYQSTGQTINLPLFNKMMNQYSPL